MHPTKALVALSIALCCAAPQARATDRIEGIATSFTSYNGVAERCVRIAPLPGATYSEADLAQEAALCALDLYDPAIALCPKIWSTSPSVVLYDLIGSKFEGEREDFQKDVCEGAKVAKYVATAELARLKFTMNRIDTSAAQSTAPLVYYHLSRFLGTRVQVAPAVWRSIDARVLRDEVAQGGADLTAGTLHLAKIHAAWTALAAAIDDPASYGRDGGYGTAEDLLTGDGALVYGTLLNATGSGFDAEVNGQDPDPWDAAERMRLFRLTPGFIALDTDAPLANAVAAGIAGAVPPVDETMPKGLPPVQVAVWAQELAETVLMDFILAQQDRPGNIDKTPRYHWVQDGQARSLPAAGHSPGDGTVPADALRLMHLVLNDNDAATRYEYDNGMMMYQVLQGLRHFDGALYLRLQALAQDMRAGGLVRQWLDNAPGLRLSQSGLIAENIIAAAEILATSCAAGLLRFDLDADAFLVTGSAPAAEVPCRPD